MLRCHLLESLLCQLLMGYLHSDQRLVLRRPAVRTKTLSRRQIDSASGEIHCERNHAWDKKQQQAQRVESHDLQIDVSMRLIPPLWIKNRAASCDQPERTGR